MAALPLAYTGPTYPHPITLCSGNAAQKPPTLSPLTTLTDAAHPPAPYKLLLISLFVQSATGHCAHSGMPSTTPHCPLPPLFFLLSLFVVGNGDILPYCGADATEAFDAYHRGGPDGRDAQDQEQYYIGDLAA